MGHALLFLPKESLFNQIAVLLFIKTIVVSWTFNLLPYTALELALTIDKNKFWIPTGWDTLCNTVTAIFLFSLQTTSLKSLFTKCFKGVFYYLQRLQDHYYSHLICKTYIISSCSCACVRCHKNKRNFEHILVFYSRISSIVKIEL